ncbi:FidL-like protein [Providencia vermicola]|uniref:FidL-like protein n=1 Tax=Providencia vermicola TaxID=333965 RepID=UPI0035259D0B
MINKILYSTMMLFTFIVVLLFIFLKLEYNKTQYCEATVFSEFIFPDSKSSYNLKMELVKNQDHTGYIKLFGTITTDKKYLINRIVHFNYSSKDDITGLKLTIIYDRKSKNDNVPDNIFEQYFKAFSLHSIAYVDINEITSEWYLFSSSFGPYFVCTKQSQLNSFN